MRVVELFAGVGGFRVGLDAAFKDYFNVIWANQWEPGSERKQYAFRCYDYHFSNTGSKNVNEDINNVWQEVPEHDLLVGGFPCQDYSVASSGAMGIEGKKGVLWWAINNIISSSKRPRYLILENVDRLIRSPGSQRGRDFGIILRCLADQGYYAEWRVLNAADYGMPQKRRRIFIFACRSDQPFAKEMSMHCYEDVVSKHGFFARTFKISPSFHCDKINMFSIGSEAYPDIVAVSNRFAKTFYKTGVMIGSSVYTRDYTPVYDGHFTTLEEILEKDVDKEFFVSEEDIPKWKFAKDAKSLVRKASNGHLYNYTEGKIPFPDNLKTAGRTMLTTEGSLNRSSHIICDPETGALRILTPTECERLNGFPDGWTADVMTTRQRYFCMGNALVVPIVERMGQTLKGIDEGDIND